jgi:hypothetical protein
MMTRPIEDPALRPAPQKKTDTTINYGSNNLNGSNMCDLGAIKWLSCKACESEFNHP